MTEAARIGYAGTLYAYLYPPLMAHLFIPVAGIGFATLKIAVTAADVAALGAAVVLTARQWNRDWLRPWPLLWVLAGLSLSVPFVAGAIATNIQGGVILLIVLAMLLSQRGRPALAGAALALAAFVKILPGIVAIYWLASRRRDCAAWCAAMLTALAALSVAAGGIAANLAYLDNLRELSGTLVPIWSNKGLPNLLYGLVGEIDKTDAFRLVAIPPWISIANFAAMLAGLALVLLPARRYRDLPRADAAGMAAAFLVATMASSIAWSHYYRFLVVAAIIWAGLRSGGHARWLLPAAVAVLSSIFFKLATEWLANRGLPDWLVGGDLIAGLALLAGLLLARQGAAAPTCGPVLEPKLLSSGCAARRAI